MDDDPCTDVNVALYSPDTPITTILTTQPPKDTAILSISSFYPTTSITGLQNDTSVHPSSSDPYEHSYDALSLLTAPVITNNTLVYPSTVDSLLPQSTHHFPIDNNPSLLSSPYDTPAIHATIPIPRDHADNIFSIMNPTSSNNRISLPLTPPHRLVPALRDGSSAQYDGELETRPLNLPKLSIHPPVPKNVQCGRENAFVFRNFGEFDPKQNNSNNSMYLANSVVSRRRDHTVLLNTKRDQYLNIEQFPALTAAQHTESTICGKSTSIPAKTMRKRGRRPKSEILAEEALVRRYTERFEDQRMHENRMVCELFCTLTRAVYANKNGEKSKLSPRQQDFVFTPQFRSFLHASITKHPSNAQYNLTRVPKLSDTEIIAKHNDHPDAFAQYSLLNNAANSSSLIGPIAEKTPSTSTTTSTSPQTPTIETSDKLSTTRSEDHISAPSMYFITSNYDSVKFPCESTLPVLLSITPQLIKDILDLIVLLNIDFSPNFPPIHAVCNHNNPKLAPIDINIVDFDILVNFAALYNNVTTNNLNALITHAHPATPPPTTLSRPIPVPASGSQPVRRGRKPRVETQQLLEEEASRVTIANLRREREDIETLITDTAASAVYLFESQYPYTRDTRNYLFNGVLHHPYNQRYRIERQQHANGEINEDAPFTHAFLITKEILSDISMMFTTIVHVYINKQHNIESLLQVDYKHNPAGTFHFSSLEKFKEYEMTGDYLSDDVRAMLFGVWGHNNIPTITIPSTSTQFQGDVAEATLFPSSMTKLAQRKRSRSKVKLNNHNDDNDDNGGVINDSAGLSSNATKRQKSNLSYKNSLSNITRDGNDRINLSRPSPTTKRKIKMITPSNQLALLTQHNTLLIKYLLASLPEDDNIDMKMIMDISSAQSIVPRSTLLLQKLHEFALSDPQIDEEEVDIIRNGMDNHND